MQMIEPGPKSSSLSSLMASGRHLGTRNAEWRGMAMVFVATVAWSFAGLFTRSLTIDVCTAVAWRSFAGGVALLALWLAHRRTDAVRDLASLRGPDWVAVLLNVLAQGAYSACLFLTSVAHVAVIYAATPFIAALIAWWWLDERLAAHTLVAILLTMTGIVTVVGGSLGTGSLAGDALALVMTAAFAILIVLPKGYPKLRITESMFISAFITFALFLPFSDMHNFDLRNGVLVGAYGAINLVLAYFLFIKGARAIPAATAGLIVTLEIVLSPFWVWLFMGETVDRSTLVGGAIVLGAVVGHLLYAMRHQPLGRSRNSPTLEAGSHG
jgi:drug/metabolite transporter (DMT)-like permease